MSGADQQHAAEELQLQRDSQSSSRSRYHLRTGANCDSAHFYTQPFESGLKRRKGENLPQHSSGISQLLFEGHSYKPAV